MFVRVSRSRTVRALYAFLRGLLLPSVSPCAHGARLRLGFAPWCTHTCASKNSKPAVLHSQARSHTINTSDVATSTAPISRTDSKVKRWARVSVSRSAPRENIAYFFLIERSRACLWHTSRIGQISCSHLPRLPFPFFPLSHLAISEA